MQWLNEHVPDLILRPLAAVVCAAILGMDRERHGKPAGLRTQMMVALGTTIFTMATMDLHSRETQGAGASVVDPTRVIAGVIGGLGFLGAGSIMQSGGSVRGLTTASTVWVVGSVGIACGLGEFRLALTATGFATAILIGVGFLEYRSEMLSDKKKEEADS
ncbi:MAG: MgtC/SapB family protein [Fuerstiella sp.]